jgi:hypothetical protein
LFPFAYQFKSLIGLDPSEGMIGEAEGAWQAWKNIQDGSKKLMAEEAQFKVSSAEHMSEIEDSSVDLILPSPPPLLFPSRLRTGSTIQVCGPKWPGYSSQMVLPPFG